ncbi:MAG TPA: hypothetical protein VGO91_05920 [Pyrinomonadaceae bacterium]|jgi:hypothetical protein|nr:hypothetical protein [Pyrinomonadaceae bacterium]
MFQTTNKFVRAGLIIASLMALFYNTSLAQEPLSADPSQRERQKQGRRKKDPCQEEKQSLDKIMPGGRPINPDSVRQQQQCMPDLVVNIQGVPATAYAGEDIGPVLKVVAKNIGGTPAAGTRSAGENGYMIDLVLSTDTNVPEGFATFSASFLEDVLLRGARISNTEDLPGGTSNGYPVGATIPSDTPPGLYLICARIDPANKIAESYETNNVGCVKLKITGPTKCKGLEPMPSKRPRNP